MAMRQNDSTTAQNHYCSQLLRSDNDNVDAALLYAQILGQQCNYSDAMDALKSYLDRHRDAFNVLILWMEMRWRSGPGWARAISEILDTYHTDDAGILFARGVFAKYLSFI
jgi:Tfp pilus assembly protein PilF